MEGKAEGYGQPPAGTMLSREARAERDPGPAPSKA